MNKKARKSDATQLAAVESLHESVDQRVSVLTGKHKARLQCKHGCHKCCVDDLTVFAVEAQVIQAHHSDLLRNGEPAPVGQCAFLDGMGGCRIYRHRPYVCRTQGLPLRWLETVEAEVFEYRDICPLNETDTPLEVLDEDDFWTLGEFEGQLAGIQASVDGALTRLALRALFQNKTNCRKPETTQKSGGWEV